VIRLAMTGLCERELAGRVEGSTYLDRLADGGVDALSNPADSPDLRDYVQLALRGGFPEPALRLSEDARREWWDGYVEQMLTRDAQRFADRDPQRLSRYLEAVSLNSAGIVEDKTIYDAAGVNRKTALAYEDLLQALYLLDVVPAWTTNRLKRLVRAPKRYLTDPALFAAGAKVSLDAVMRDANLLGRVLDTFVAAQLRAELPIGASRPRLFHLRQYDGRHEVDLIAELDAHRVIGIEIKADSAPGSSSAHHLRWLRDELGDRFVAGIVMHTGPRVYRLDDRIVAAPIATLWN
jgi:predicted AAA+ superfamily ATPase